MANMTLGAARADYYKVNQFGDDGGDALDWVPIKLFFFTIKIPNTQGRKKAVKVHDLHHVLTGYDTDLTGESEIAAWELATGCRRVPAALVLNLFALAIGLVIAPVKITRAWARGRRTQNLYAHANVDELLGQDVAAVRAQLGLDAARPATRAIDLATVGAIAIPMLAVMIGVVVAPLAGVFFGLSALANSLA